MPQIQGDQVHKHSILPLPAPLHSDANGRYRSQNRGSAAEGDVLGYRDDASDSVALSNAIHDGSPNRHHPQGGSFFLGLWGIG
jgi:hypothetical protein